MPRYSPAAQACLFPKRWLRLECFVEAGLCITAIIGESRRVAKGPRGKGNFFDVPRRIHVESLQQIAHASIDASLPSGRTTVGIVAVFG